jgi:putative MATE family efflux protein
MPIGRLLLSMSIPMMVSFFIQALYNMVDSMFVAKISEDALTAVSIAFPLQQIITAIGVGTGVSVNALVPRYLGQGNPDKARRIANVTVLLSALYTLVFILVGTFGIRAYYTMQTDVETIVDAGVSYLTVICIVSCGAFFGQNFEKQLVSTGNTVCSMLAQASGAIFNLIFDPLLIFGLGPFPAMGVRGAAVATVLGQIFAALVALVLLLWKEKTIRLSFRSMVPSLPLLREIFSIAIPSMITVGLASAMSFCLNQILLAFSTTATAVFGIWLKLQNFSFMPIFGMNNGTIPIISYNYGAGAMDRVKKTISLALKAALGLMLLLVLVFECIPNLLLSMFSASDYMLEIGTVALRITCLSLPFGAVSLILSSSFQSLGYSRYTLLVNLCRQLLFIVPIAWLMSLSGNLSLVWTATVLAEALSMLLAIVLNRKVHA